MDRGFCAGLAQSVRDDGRECEQGDALKKVLGFILHFEVSIGGKFFYPQRGLHDA
jgi:hypothetical protein